MLHEGEAWNRYDYLRSIHTHTLQYQQHVSALSESWFQKETLTYQKIPIWTQRSKWPPCDSWLPTWHFSSHNCKKLKITQHPLSPDWELQNWLSYAWTLSITCSPTPPLPPSFPMHLSISLPLTACCVNLVTELRVLVSSWFMLLSLFQQPWRPRKQKCSGNSIVFLCISDLPVTCLYLVVCKHL